MPKTRKAKDMKATYVARRTRSDGARVTKPRAHPKSKRVSPKVMPEHKLGKYIVVAPEIQDGGPVFVGTRIMVAEVLNQVATGEAWNAIIKRSNGQLSKPAVAEAVRLASNALVKQSESLLRRSDQDDVEIINRNADRLNKEALDVLNYQVIP